jgi:CRP-like cAMP-binding protein
MKFAAHDRGTARTLIRRCAPPSPHRGEVALIRSSAGSPPLESIPPRISAAERQPIPRVVDLSRVSNKRERRVTVQEEPRPLMPEFPRRVAESSFAETIRPSRVVSFTYLRGQRLFGPTEGHGVIYVVRAGCVRLTKTLPNGRSISLGLYGPDTVFSQEEREHDLVTGVSAEALVDTVVSSLERSSLRALLAESPDLAAAIIEGLMRHQVDLHQLVEQVLARDVMVRLASVLLELGNRFGLPMTDGFTKIALPVPHQLLANMIGSNRVTVTRKLADMRELGMAGTLGRNIITIRPSALHEHIRSVSCAPGNGLMDEVDL